MLIEKYSEREKLLSIVIISKNEERNIGECIESVFSAIAPLHSWEVILADSASTDATVDIAQEYPIKVLQLQPSWRLTPAAGRYVGFKNTNGRYVFFLDGDSFVHDKWFEYALPYFEEEPKAAVILGRRLEFYENQRHSDGNQPDFYEIRDAVKRLIPFADSIGGSALYRSSVLNQVGGFNPYLYSMEESELCFRIHRLGYDILAIPHNMIIHRTFEKETLTVLRKKSMRNFNLGIGQLLRYSIQNRMITKGHIKSLSMMFSFMVCLLFGIVGAGLSLITENVVFVLGWGGFVVFLFLAWVLRSKSIRRPLYYMLDLGWETYGAIRGFLMSPKDPGSYPTDVRVVKGV
jgi:glycosyltransferase involved in cell wall biosynthesis